MNIKIHEKCTQFESKVRMKWKFCIQINLKQIYCFDFKSLEGNYDTKK